MFVLNIGIIIHSVTLYLTCDGHERASTFHSRIYIFISVLFIYLTCVVINVWSVCHDKILYEHLSIS